MQSRASRLTTDSMMIDDGLTGYVASRNAGTPAKNASERGGILEKKID